MKGIDKGMGRLHRAILRGKHGIEFLFETGKYFVTFPFAWFIYHKKNVWVISERGTDARDNGYHFYKFMKEKHPEQEVCFILDKKSVDYPKVAAYGNIIQYRSLKHYMIYVGAKIKISTHDCGCAPDRWWYSKLEKRGAIPGKRVFLQHGITKDDMVMLHKDKTGIHLFICGAKPEYEYVLNHFGYTRQQVKYTGFARYDNLQNYQIKRQILIMPTWRMDMSVWSKIQIRESEYVRKWNSILNNHSLLAALKENNIRLIFYPHYELQQCVHFFKSEIENICIASFKDYDVQQLLKESALLVTDYSSVYFDFCYMHKPVVYYQFDREHYRTYHYKEGYFDYDTMGFGPVASEENAAVNHILFYVKNNFSREKKYEIRAEKFFLFHDQNNCDRIYGEIMNLKK